MGYIIKTVNVINVPGSSKVPADVAELADAHGSGPCAARLKGSTPFVGTIFKWHRGNFERRRCGYGISAVHQPSKLVRGVRPPLPAPLRWDSRVAKGGRL